MNEVADSTDVSDEDTESRLSTSMENRRKDVSEHVSTSHESSEGKNFIRKVSSGSLESSSEDDHEWITRDNDDGNYFRVHHQTVQRKWADDNHDHGDSSDDQSADGTSLVGIQKVTV